MTWVGRAARAVRGRGAAARPRALHGRPRSGPEREARGDRPLAVRPRAHRARRRLGGARARPASSASSPAPRSPRSRGRSPPAPTAPCRTTRRRTRSRATRASRVAVVVAREPLPRRGRGRARRRRLRPARAGGAARCTTARSRTARSTRRSPPPTSSSRSASPFPRWTCTPVECYGVIADWQGDSLTAWSNFQGPFSLHGGRGLGARPHRLEAAADHAAGLRRLVRDQVGGLRLRRAARARVAQARRARALDGGPARAPRRERPRDRPRHRGRGGLRRRRRAARPALRRRRGRRRLHPRARAGDALPDARLALGRLPRAERRGAEPRRADEPLPDRAEPRLRRPAALLRARADDGDRGAAARDRPGRARAAQPRRASSRTGRRAAGSTTPATTRRASTTRSSSSATRSAAREQAAGRALGIGLACVVEPSISNMGYITLAQTAEERAAGLPKSGNAEGCTISISPAGGITVRLSTTPQGQGHRTVAAQIVADRLGVEPGGGRGAVRAGHVDERLDGRLGQLLVALRGRRRRRGRGGGGQARREDRGDPRAPRRGALAPPRRRDGALEPRVAARRDGARPRTRPPTTPRRTSTRPTTRIGSPPPRPTASSSTSPSSRSTATRAQVRILDYVTVHDAGRLLNPLIVDGQIRGGFAHGAGAALFERIVYDEDGDAADRARSWTTSARPRPTCRR